jgi:multiple sugar transport system substrate-binding protein
MNGRAKVLAAAVGFGLVLAGCSSGGGGASAQASVAQARGPITIWYSNNEQEVAWGKSMVEAWNAAHPDEKIDGQEIPAGKSSEEVIGAAITAGTTPCLVFNTAPSAVGQFQRQGGLVNLATFPDGASYIESRTGAAASQYKADDGGYYQLPWKANPVMIFYNKDMFKKAGLDAEKPDLSTFDNFLAAARKLKSSGAAKYAINPAASSEFYQPQFDFMPVYAAESGGKQIVADGKAVFNDAAGLATANFWKTIYAEGLAGKETVQGDAFATKVSAMAIVGPWAIASYKGKVNWGAVPVPTSTGKAANETYTFSDAKNVGLYSACKNQATAWDVLKFATSQEQDGDLLTKTGQMPLRADLQKAYPDFFTKNPAYTQFGDQAARVVEVPGGPHTVEILQILRDAYTKAVISGEGDLQQSLNDAADKVNALLAQ